MKLLTLAFLSATAVTSLAFASTSNVDLRKAQIDAAGENLVVDVQHGGGCEEHKYVLEMEGCAESMPVQCTAVVRDLTFDACEAIVGGTATFNFAELGLNTAYYSNASLVVKGARSSVTVTLPDFSGASTGASTTATDRTVCVTNTGAQLTVNGDKTEATLIPVLGYAVSYGITNARAVVIETMPSIEQWTYSLDDNRKLVIEFQWGQKVGTGHWIRLDGTASPEFKSCMLVK